MKISVILFLLILTNCSIDSVKNEFRIFEKHKSNSNYEKSLKSLNKILSISKDKSVMKKVYLEMADLNLEKLKDPESAIIIYKKLAQLSGDENEKNEYQYLISKIYLEDLNDFDSAIKEANGIVYEKSSNEVIIKAKQILIKSYKNKKNYFQALIEVNDVLNNLKTDKERQFEFNMMKADILTLENKHTESNEIYENLIKNYPSRAINEKVFLNILANFEAMGAYDKAIKLLEASLSKHNMGDEFIKSKLKRLNDLKNNMPGAKGLGR